MFRTAATKVIFVEIIPSPKLQLELELERVVTQKVEEAADGLRLIRIDWLTRKCRRS